MHENTILTIYLVTWKAIGFSGDRIEKDFTVCLGSGEKHSSTLAKNTAGPMMPQTDL